MTSLRDPSVDDLRRESERSRAALTNTVVQLREMVSDTADDLKTRLSPAHIKEEVKDYVREGSDQFFHSIARKARENPLQAVAIGAGLAYPLRGLLKSIPVPIMLVGTGLWLLRQKAAAHGGGYAGGMAQKLTEAGAEGASRVSDAVRGAAASVSAGAGTVTDKVRTTAHDIRNSATGMTQSVVGSVKDGAESAADSVSKAGTDTKNRVSELSDQTKNLFGDLVERNPLLVGGIGLAIGAFIAASLPPSDAENRMFGERSDDLKDKAMEVASQAVERAKDVAAGTVPKAVEDVTEGVKSVVEKGLKTALGEPT